MPDKRKKLTAGQVKAIRKQSKAGKTPTELSRQFHISAGHVCHIVAGINWKNSKIA